MQLYLLNNKYFYFGCISLNIACKFKCYISKSTLVLSECNDLYFIALAFNAFMLHEIKQCPVQRKFICILNLTILDINL